MTDLTRRALLAGSVGIVLGALTACRPSATSPDPSTETLDVPSTPTSLLVAYFSRPGENYWYGGRRTLRTGNTETLAGLITGQITADVYRIEAADPYPDSYDATVARNVQEQRDDARPAIAHPLPDIGRYDAILLGSPIWNVRPPMILHTFLDALELTGKTIAPFVTYAVSGLGSTVSRYSAAAPTATVLDGLTVLGEEAAAAEPAVTAWLRAHTLTP